MNVWDLKRRSALWISLELFFMQPVNLVVKRRKESFSRSSMMYKFEWEMVTKPIMLTWWIIL